MSTTAPHYTCKIIKLKKVKHAKLQILQDALVHYCNTIHHNEMQFLELHLFYLAAKMAHDLLGKINKQPVPETVKLTWYFHEAHVMYLALNEYIRILDAESHTKAVCLNLNFEIHNQMI